MSAWSRRGLIERVLALQRAVGNRATAALLQRSEVTSGADPVVRLTMGSDIELLLAFAAWKQTEKAPLDDQGLAALRPIAEQNGTIDDNERMFLAALLNPDNARRWHASTPTGPWGSTVEFKALSITPANRRRVQDFGRGTTPASTGPKRPNTPAGRAAALDDAIVDLAGSFVATAKAALAIVDEAGVSHTTLYYAMLNGASDSTPGDRAFAGAVYAIARRERLGVAAEIMAGRVKVDQVPRSYLSQDAEGMYQPEATTTGRKGDTVYLPSDVDFTSVIAQALVVHELTHAEADAAATSLQTMPVVDAELPAFRAEAAFLIHVIKTRAGAARRKSVQDIAQEIRLPVLYCMLLEATEIIDHDAIAVVEELHAEVVGGSGDPATALAFPAKDFKAFVSGLKNDDRHYDFFVALETRARNAINRAYKNHAPAPDGGLAGESALDTPSVPPAGATLQRQPKGRDGALSALWRARPSGHRT